MKANFVMVTVADCVHSAVLFTSNWSSAE